MIQERSQLHQTHTGTLSLEDEERNAKKERNAEKERMVKITEQAPLGREEGKKARQVATVRQFREKQREKERKELERETRCENLRRENRDIEQRLLIYQEVNKCCTVAGEVQDVPPKM